MAKPIHDRRSIHDVRQFMPQAIHVRRTHSFSPFFGFPLRGSSCIAGDEVSMCFKNRLEGKAYLYLYCQLFALGDCVFFAV